MTRQVRLFIAAIAAQGTPAISPTEDPAYARVRVEVPRVRGLERTKEGLVVVWDEPRTGSTADVGNSCLDDLVAIADAEDEAFVRYAERYGPLTRGMAIGVDDRTRGVPLFVLRDLAKGLRGVVSSLGAGDGPQVDDIATAANAVSWLRDPRPMPELNIDGSRSRWGQHVEKLLTEMDPADRVIALAALLGAQGRKDRSRMVYPIVPTRVVQLDDRAGYFWVLPDARPVLGVQLEQRRLAGTLSWRNCPICGEKINQIPAGRKLPKGQPFYGEHDACRAEAKRISRRDSARKRYYEKKQLAEKVGGAAG